jgi:hypothetical protein
MVVRAEQLDVLFRWDENEIKVRQWFSETLREAGGLPHRKDRAILASPPPPNMARNRHPGHYIRRFLGDAVTIGYLRIDIAARFTTKTVIYCDT